ncbi:hypothetical protein [Endozoicomonas elysicola]|nr:hypothetical protein [Endozoicomonas elysicola]
MGQRHNRNAMQLACFMIILFFTPIAIWQFAAWLFTPSAPAPEQTIKAIIALDSSELYIWRVCPRGSPCYDKFRLCIKSRQLPSPESNYCFISASPIPEELDQLEPGTIANIRIAPDLDIGRIKVLRFWEMKVEGQPSLSLARISQEHNDEKNNRLVQSLMMLGFSMLAAALYRRSRRQARRY